MKHAESKCKICTHPLRDEIDEMLLAEIRYASILMFAGEHGLQLSASGLSRHKNHHFGNSESDLIAQIEDAVKKHLARCLRELKRRDVESLSVEELIANAQTAAEALAVVNLPLKIERRGRQPR